MSNSNNDSQHGVVLTVYQLFQALYIYFLIYSSQQPKGWIAVLLSPFYR